jgi:hypothetical protein
MILACLVPLQLAMAQNTDSVHSISRGENKNPHLVKFTSGRVLFIEQGHEEELQKFEAELASKLMSKRLSSFEASGEDKFLENESINAGPSVLSGGQIQEVFHRMNPNIKRRSECSDRAHVWVYDEFQRGIVGEKAFLFLTDTYIRRTGFKWWFHVAPAYTLAGGQKMVLDYQFIDHPVTLTEWKNNLVFSKRDCIMDFNFNTYNAGADQTQDCYMRIAPMFYHFPGEIGSWDNGTPRSAWSESEVNSARARAFYTGSP